MNDYCLDDIWVVTWDFQQFDILTSVDSDEPVQPLVKLRTCKWFLACSLILIKYMSKGSDPTEHMRRLVRGFAGCTYDIVG